MKLTKPQLKQIIKEELGKVMEGADWHGTFDIEGGPEADIQHAIQMLKEVDHLTGKVAKSATQMLEEYGVQAAEQVIQMLEAEEDTTGQFYHVINRLYGALDKMDGDPDDYDDDYGDDSFAYMSAGLGTDEDYGYYGDD